MATKRDLHQHLSRRERQIMDVLFARAEVSAADVQAALPGAPSYSTVRALLRKLVEKGHVAYRQEGARYLYRPVQARKDAARTALDRLIATFFGGRAADAVMNLLGTDAHRLDENDIAEIEQAVKRLKREATRR